MRTVTVTLVLEADIDDDGAAVKTVTAAITELADPQWWDRELYLVGEGIVEALRVKTVQV